MTQAAAIDLGELGIRVNSVVPGPTRTQLMAGLEDDSFAFMPVPRMGEPAEIAAAVQFLASHEAPT